MHITTVVYIVTILFLVTTSFFVWRDVYVHTRGVLIVAFLDVGQGDSIYIESPTGVQVLVDAGADRDVLSQLHAVMPLFDRSIDMILATHPDMDHVGGFSDVLGHYRVGKVVYQEIAGDTGASDIFERSLVREKLEEGAPNGDFVVEPHRGDVWDIGGGAYIVLHYPDRAGEASDTNASSVIARVVYGDTSFLLMGDSPQEVEEYVVQKDGEQLQSDVLKLGHHGSRTSSSPLFLGTVKPSYAVISRGCDNSYGHPHKEVLDALVRFNIPALDTCLNGRVVFESDGNSVERK
jgi:competence protein ComEC